MRRRHYARIRLHLFEPGDPARSPRPPTCCALPSSCPASTRRPRSARSSPTFSAALPQRDGLRLRQQLDRQHGRGRRRPPAPRCAASTARARATSCAGCSRTSTPTSTSWSTATTPTTPRPRPTRSSNAARRPSTWSSGGGSRRIRRLSRRATARQPRAHRVVSRAVRRADRRHAVRLSRVLAPVREELPVVLARVRDRDRAHRARDADAHADRRGRSTTRSAPGSTASCARSATAGGSC